MSLTTPEQLVLIAVLGLVAVAIGKLAARAFMAASLARTTTSPHDEPTRPTDHS